MAETQTQDAAQPEKPVTEPNTSPERTHSGRFGPKLTQQEWIAQRKDQRAEAQRTQKAIESLKESESKPETESQSDGDDQTTETSRDDQVSDDADAQTEAEAEAQEAADTQSQDDTQEYFPETLTEFAEAVGVDPKDFVQGIVDTVKVNGQEVQVSIADLREAYASKSERDRLGVTLAEERKAAEAESQQRRDEWTNRLQQADTFLHVASSLLDMGPSEQELAQLAQTDEIKYLKARADRDQKIQQIQAVAAHRQELVKKAQQEQQEETAKVRKQQQDGLMDWKPELQDAGKLSAFENRMRTGLKSHYSYTDDEINSFFSSFDLRNLKVLDDAMRYREMKMQERPVRQRLKTLPKLSKPGQKRSDAQLASDKVQSARNRLKSSGSVDDARAYLRARRAQRNQTSDRSK